MCGVELLRAIPDTLIPGDSYDVSLSEPDYPATAGWSLRWSLAGPQRLDVESAPDGAAHVLALSVSATGVLTAGVYGWQLRATNTTTGKAHTIRRGELRVESDLAAFAAGENDGPAFWDKLIEACDRALLENVSGGGMMSYMVAGRQVMFQSLDQVRRVRAWAVSERARRRRGSAFGKVRVNLVRGW